MTKIRKAVIPAAGSPLQLTFSRGLRPRVEGALTRGELWLSINRFEKIYD